MHRDPLPQLQTEARATHAGVGSGAVIATIVLIPERMKVSDRIGHHDDLAGCLLLASLLEQTAGVERVVGRDGWLTDDTIFDDASTAIFYTGGCSMRSIFSSWSTVAEGW